MTAKALSRCHVKVTSSHAAKFDKNVHLSYHLKLLTLTGIMITMRFGSMVERTCKTESYTYKYFPNWVHELRTSVV